MKQEIEVIVYEVGSIEYDLPTTPKEFLSWWEEKFALVPEEFRDSTVVEVSSGSYYDSTMVSVTVRYTRMETDVEEEKREALEGRRAKQKEEEERRKYLELQKKYG